MPTPIEADGAWRLSADAAWRLAGDLETLKRRVTQLEREIGAIPRPQPRRGRGRPKGSKNKPKPLPNGAVHE